MRLNHNMNSLELYSNYKRNLVSNEKSVLRISSGVKYSVSKDNPNKVSQSEKIRIQIKCTNMANRNVQDASSMLQAADGALQEANNILSRMKELAVSAANDSKEDVDKDQVQAELEQLNKGLNDLVNGTEFNGVRLIGDTEVVDNAFPNYREIAIGSMVGDKARIPVYDLRTDSIRDDKGNSLADINVLDTSAAGDAIHTIDYTIDLVSSIRSKYGALENRFSSSADALVSNSDTMEKADSNLIDTDIALEMAEFSRTQILTQSGIALIAQSNKFPMDVLQILERIK